MQSKLIREWKKVYEADLSYISYELKEMVKAPAMIILDGPMGSGKTSFVKSFAPNDQILSPTYTVISETPSTLHADLDRIENREDLIMLELDQYLNEKSFFLVEWGKKHFYSLLKEIPEEFSHYLLEISLAGDNPDDNDPSLISRNYKLSEIFEE